MVSNISFTSLAELFADVHALPVGESSHHRGPRCRCYRWVNGVDVVAQVDWLLHTVHTESAPNFTTLDFDLLTEH